MMVIKNWKGWWGGMTKKILTVIFLMALLISLFVIKERIFIENRANGVELIMDFSVLERLEDSPEAVLESLQREGLTAVAVYPDIIDKLLKDDGVFFIDGSELLAADLQTGRVNPELAEFTYTGDSAFILFEDSEIIQRVEDFLLEWEQRFDIEYSRGEERLILFFPEWDNKFCKLSIGFDREMIGRLKSLGLKVVLRMGNSSLSREFHLTELEELAPEFLIFSGDEITGYDSETQTGIRETAALLQDRGITFGMIEAFIAKQKGAEKLAYLLDFDLLRVHSIQQEEMDYRTSYTMDMIVERYLRAVRERNNRLLYLKPFLQEKEGLSPVRASEEFVGQLAGRLQKAGYIPGRAEPFPNFSSHGIVLLFIGLGIIIAGIYLLFKLLNLQENLQKRLFWLLLLAGLLVEIVLLLAGRELLLRKILALGSSIVFPALAIITCLLNKDRKRGLISSFILASLISLIGGVFVAGSLAHSAFMLQVAYFTGVKLSFIMPVILISYYYFFCYRGNGQSRRIITDLRSFLDMEIRVKHLLLLFLLGLGGLIYIGRTGNTPLIPVPEMEVQFRALLERLLIVRPRFKEFLVGHPFFILALGLKERLNSGLLFFLLLIAGTVGQITIINSFSHIHTPFFIAFIRFFHGIWLGVLIGLVLLFLARYFLGKVRRDEAGLNE